MFGFVISITDFSLKRYNRLR